jgi:hypothetical protein
MIQRLKFGAAMLACAGVFAAAETAFGHGLAGDRVFPATLLIDDPAVGDELSLPTFTYQPQGPTREYDYGFEWDKTIIEGTSVAINDGYTILRQPGTLGGDVFGWNNLVVTLKSTVYVNEDHEIMMSVGVQRELSGGATNHGLADSTASTAPTYYVGKGFGDLPASLNWLRPFALTGEVAYQFPDEGSQTLASGPQFNPNFLNLGASIQYSVPFLTSQIKAYDWPHWMNGLIPLVEFSYSTPATAPHGTTTTGTIAPGILWEQGPYQLGLEALIPATKASGNGTGLLAQFHVFLDDMFPKSIGKPLF